VHYLLLQVVFLLAPNSLDLTSCFDPRRPSPDYSGGDSFTYVVSDNQGGVSTATVFITVDPVNDKPTANDDLSSTDQGTALDVSVLSNDSDPEDDPLTVTAVSTGVTVNGGTVSIVDAGAGTIKYT